MIPSYSCGRKSPLAPQLLPLTKTLPCRWSPSFPASAACLPPSIAACSAQPALVLRVVHRPSPASNRLSEDSEDDSLASKIGTQLSLFLVTFTWGPMGGIVAAPF
jgi:hypothetical protein